MTQTDPQIATETRGGAGRGLLAAASGAFLAERERWFLWLPVAFGTGVALYFALLSEPPLWLGIAGLGVGLVVTFIARTHAFGRWTGFALAGIAAGFLVAQYRAAEVEAPMLFQEIGPEQVTGRVLEARPVRGGKRLLLEQVAIEGLDADATPERVRVTLRKEIDPIIPGVWVDLWAVLSPPFEPVAPGAFDFARRAYFERLGGSGYALGAARLIEPPAGATGGGLHLWLSELRYRLAERITAAQDNAAGGVAAALMVGERGRIPEESLVAMRNAGLAHLLAISGLHVGLVAGIVFVVLRALFALIEPLALRYPIKKWTALATVLAAFGYLLISGLSVPTQRAFLMTALVLLAVLLDRTSISMRLIAWAAIAVLLVSPESLLGPSFQMSFAAATALIATYEICRRPLARWQARARWGVRPMVYFSAVTLTTLVAGFATAPFAAYHFNRIADYSLVANLGAVPITAFWIMPWGIVAFLLMPFGAEALALVPMAWGIEAVLWIARTVSGWPGAVTLVPAMPVGALALIVAGGIWLCLWRRRWRLFGVLPIVGGLAFVLFIDTPDILVDGRGKLFAVKYADGTLALSSKTRARFAGEIWLRRSGQAEPAPWPKEGTSADGRLACDRLGCIYRAGDRVTALVADPRALIDDCAIADLVVSLVPVFGACPEVPIVVDRFDVWREGAYAFWFEDDGVRVRSVREARGERPWTLDRTRK